MIAQPLVPPILPPNAPTPNSSLGLATRRARSFAAQEMCFKKQLNVQK
jgi:hypothetical protein